MKRTNYKKKTQGNSFFPERSSQILLYWLFSDVHRYCRYLFCCSYAHNVAPKGKFIAFVTTEAETEHPEVELKPGIDLLGPVDEIFYDMYDRFEPCNDHEADGCFISTVSIEYNLMFCKFTIRILRFSLLSFIII